jgi:hypothetical protein
VTKKRYSFRDAVAVRLAVFKDRRTRSRYTRRSMTVFLGAALSVGGLSQMTDDVHFLVQKDLDGVRIVRTAAEGEGDGRVVASLGDSFAGNSVFKLSRMAPESFVSRRLSLFDAGWLDATRVDLGQEITLFNESMREQFFRTELPFGNLIYEKSQKYDVDPALVAAVMEAESAFRPRARSPVGAAGLMQLMPRTGRWMGARNLYDPEQNVEAGVKYLKYLENRFSGNLTKQIAAYNAGEGNVRRYGGVPPFRETRSYVTKVMQNYEKRNKQLEEFKESSLEQLSEELLGR